TPPSRSSSAACQASRNSARVPKPSMAARNKPSGFRQRLAWISVPGRSLTQCSDSTLSTASKLSAANGSSSSSAASRSPLARAGGLRCAMGQLRLGIARLVGVALLLCSSAGAVARELPAGDPERLGFSPQRLARIDAWYQAQVEAGALPGAVVAIARHGEVA